ncbi:MAG: hypothetical protein FJ086_03705 [Deltaproteobacteria bacterium]|nr:hypothetical protein [Deltaproteobacteria bacterium]
MSIRVLLAALLSVTPVPVSAQDAGAGEPLDRVVAVINREVVTLSELRFEARVALAHAGRPEALAAPLDGPLLRSTLDYVVGQRLQVAEADKLQAFYVEQQEVEAALFAFERRLGGPEAVTALLVLEDMGREALAAVISRRIRAERALDGKLRLKAQVSDAEVRRAWEVSPGSRAQPFDAVRAEIRDRLTRERYRALAQSEFARLRRAADVRVVAPADWALEPPP